MSISLASCKVYTRTKLARRVWSKVEQSAWGRHASTCSRCYKFIAWRNWIQVLACNVRGPRVLSSSETCQWRELCWTIVVIKGTMQHSPEWAPVLYGVCLSFLRSLFTFPVPPAHPLAHLVTTTSTQALYTRNSKWNRNGRRHYIVLFPRT